MKHSIIPEWSETVRNLREFKEISDVIGSNRYSKELADVEGKVYTRDLFNEN